ncbi:isochorismatase family cysteine hydrolase [Bacillus altitudinis]|uniref:isochorismatase family cysteine hydrolase n=1 Tax=Bacillus altitudinis TaxID=293387 RepID=UPI001C221025|nr:isochorismatase family cysteine hydrolase [Bacillus altitudinis]MBU8694923.1 cysteine hydrolase [Bacillus altitudinis]WRO26110.1 isochorismatase family cysteine hydrolase [Bacillus altitudinis]
MPKQQKALLIIDMINNFDFEMGHVLAEKTEQMTNKILALKQHAFKKNWPIIYINDHYGLWKADLKAVMETCKNERSAPILEQMAPSKDDYFLIKPKHSAFYGTALETLLNELGVQELILTGIAGNICVLFTANDAYMREYNLTVPKDCIASNDDRDNEYALTMMENVLLAKITTTKEITDENQT